MTFIFLFLFEYKATQGIDLSINKAFVISSNAYLSD